MKDISHLSKRVQNMYKVYWGKVWFRLGTLIAVIIGVIKRPQDLKVMEGWNFFHSFTPYHVLWLLWLWYMLEKLFPLKNMKPKGCMKYMVSEYKQVDPATVQNYEEQFRKQNRFYNKGALIVAALWGVVGLALFLLHRFKVVNQAWLLVITCIFYLGDVVCIMVWCPFRAIFMRNLCCTQCRIYNWDTIMMVVPLISVVGFFGYSLVLLSIVDVVIWEIMRLKYPERYYPISNANLQCANCGGEIGCARLKRNSRTKKERLSASATSQNVVRGDVRSAKQKAM